MKICKVTIVSGGLWGGVGGTTIICDLLIKGDIMATESVVGVGT